MPRESTVVRAIREMIKPVRRSKYLNLKGSAASSTQPDILWVWHGQAFVFEAKAAEDADHQPGQDKQLELWNRAGAITAFVWTKWQVKIIINSWASQNNYTSPWKEETAP